MIENTIEIIICWFRDIKNYFTEVIIEKEVKIVKIKVFPDADEWVRKQLIDKYNFKIEYIDDLIEQYYKLPYFKINENIHEVLKEFKVDIKMTDDLQKVVKLFTTYHCTNMFQAMKVDLNDPNTQREISEGNIGTPGRFAKMMIGKNQEDDSELLSGRWIKKPRLASFPNENTSREIPITKRVDIVAVCSHHIAPFSSMFREDAYALISYIPEDKVLGISKLQRLADWIGRRGWLQEDLSIKLFQEISDAAETKNVYVRLYNIVHNCEFLRGTQSNDGAFTSEYYDGKFKDKKYRDMVLQK